MRRLFVCSQRLLIFPCFANHKNILTGCTFKNVISNATVILQGTSYQFFCSFHHSSTVIRTHLNKNIQSKHIHIYFKYGANLYRINKKSVKILCNYSSNVLPVSTTLYIFLHWTFRDNFAQLTCKSIIYRQPIQFGTLFVL